MTRKPLRSNLGRPPLDSVIVREIADRLRAGERPRDIQENSGVGLTKIYEIRRLLLSRGGAA